MRSIFLAALAACVITVAGCTTNAVTGKRQFTMPITQQVAIGNRQYSPSLQQQGGRYIVDPELNLYIASVGKKLSVHSPLKLPYEFTVIDNEVPNAWALPGGKMAINTGLLVLLEDEAQLAAVLGHEIIHAAAEHSARQMAQAQLIGFGALAVGVAARDNEYAQYIGLGTALASGVWQAKYGRDQELEADHYGMNMMSKAGYEPQGAVELQQTFVTLSQGRDSNWLDNLFASHPPSQERVEKNKERAATLPRGTRNRAAYQRAIKQLKADMDAESAHKAALKQADAKNYNEAYIQVNSAIRKQPKAAKYYITKGNILSAMKRENEAYDAYSLAASRNPDFFLGHLHKGLVGKKLNKHTAAERALEKSMKLLALPITAYHLGDYAQRRGDKQTAVKLLRFAAQDKGDVGQAAAQELSKLEPAQSAQ